MSGGTQRGHAANKTVSRKDANQMSDMLQLVVEIGITQAMILPVTAHIESFQS